MTELSDEVVERLAERTFPELNIHVPLREYLERVLAGMFSRMPDMSGDQRKRLVSHELRKVESCAEELLRIIATFKGDIPVDEG